MIINFAKFSIIDGKMENAKESVKALAAMSLMDPGCKEYTLGKNINTENALYVIEKWENIELLNQHMQTAHIKEFDAAAKEFLAAPPKVTTLHIL